MYYIPARCQWIGGMRADEAIDYYMPSIAARSSHRSVSFARSRPTTINPARSRAEPRHPLPTEEDDEDEDDDSSLGGGAKTPAAGTPRDSPAYARPVSSGRGLHVPPGGVVDSPHVVRLKRLVNGYDTKM